MYRSPRGFSLIELLVATTILAIGISSAAQLFVLAVNAGTRARQTTVATVLARQKLEQLRTVRPPLAASPPGALDHDVPGFSDVVDGVYRRRWSIEPLPSSPDALVLQVRLPDHGVQLLTVKAADGP